MPIQKYKAALIQQQSLATREANLKQMITSIESAAQQGAKLIVLPELHNHDYFCQRQDVNHFELAETIPGPTTDLFSALAKKLSVVIVVSLFEKRDVGIYHNTAVIIEQDGTIAGKYRKMHIPDDPGFNEKFYFSPGDLNFAPIKTSLGKIGVLICWDQWFPEAARLMALAGADILLYPTAIGWGTQELPDEKIRQRDAWMTIQKSHAVANGLFVLVCNRIGFETVDPNKKHGIHFWGSSFVAGPQGEILAEASVENAELLMSEIDLQRVKQVRHGWPFLRDRRIDAYEGLLRRCLVD